MVHNASRSCEDDVAELTRWQELDDPLLKITELDVVAGADDTGLVDASIELDNNLAVAVVINFLELTDVSVPLHDAQELDNNLGAWSDENLTLARLLCVVDGIERIVEDASFDHCGGGMRFSNGGRQNEVSRKL